MKLTPEALQLIIAVVVLLLFVVVPFITRMLLKTKWGREHNAELALLQDSLTAAQALLVNHQAALEAQTLAIARAVAVNGGCGRVWHELELLKPMLGPEPAAALERARIGLERKTGLTGGKRSRRERNWLRALKKGAMAARRVARPVCDNHGLEGRATGGNQ